MIKLSVIVPIYAVEQYLRKCVDSLLAQDLPSVDYEIILVDDGYADCSLGVIKESEQQISNLHLLVILTEKWHILK